MSSHDNFMNQDVNKKVEIGYFAKRKKQFNKELEKGFIEGFGKENITNLNDSKAKKPAKKKENKDEE